MRVLKHMIVLCCALVAVSASDDHYTDKYDNIDLMEILENKRLLTAYMDCILDRGKCTPEGKELRENLEDALHNGCAKCTKSQEKGAHTVIQFLIKNELPIWKDLAEKFDPEGKFRKKYEDRARAEGIEIPN